MSTTKKIGILTSGGDCAGLNAVIRAVVNSASRLGWEVYGIKNGTDGLTEKPLAYEILTVHNFSLDKARRQEYNISVNERAKSSF